MLANWHSLTERWAVYQPPSAQYSYTPASTLVAMSQGRLAKDGVNKVQWIKDGQSFSKFYDKEGDQIQGRHRLRYSAISPMLSTYRVPTNLDRYLLRLAHWLRLFKTFCYINEWPTFSTHFLIKQLTNNANINNAYLRQEICNYIFSLMIYSGIGETQQRLASIGYSPLFSCLTVKWTKLRAKKQKQFQKKNTSRR